LVLVCLCLVAYVRLWDNDFIEWDDPVYATDNPHLYAGQTWENLSWAWTTNDTGFWLPLVWISFQVDGTVSHELGWDSGLAPSVYLAQNLFWHAATTFVLALTMLRTTGRFWPSACVAALFAVQPLQDSNLAVVGHKEQAASLYAQSLRVDPNWPAANLEAAWTLATAPDVAPGDAATACQLAGEGCQAAGRHPPTTWTCWPRHWLPQACSKKQPKLPPRRLWKPARARRVPSPGGWNFIRQTRITFGSEWVRGRGYDGLRRASF
jgi:hypothetical protein